MSYDPPPQRFVRSLEYHPYTILVLKKYVLILWHYSLTDFLFTVLILPKTVFEYEKMYLKSSFNIFYGINPLFSKQM